MFEESHLERHMLEEILGVLLGTTHIRLVE
jgi:hypothetical protein